MRKLLLGAILLFSVLSFVRCVEKVDYECKGLIEKSDWNSTKLTGGTFIYSINKKAILRDLIDNPLTANDSIEFSILGVDNFKKIPQPVEMKAIIIDALRKCEESCKNKATFKPYKLSIVFVDEKKPRTPTELDTKELKLQWTFLNDEEESIKMIEKGLNDIKNGRTSELIISVDFLASNSYGTPGKLYSTMSYDIKSKKLYYNGANEL